MSRKQSKQLGAFIEHHRLAKGLSQERLGKEAGLPGSTIWRLERGQIAAPAPDKLQRIARALDVDFEDLFSLVGYATPDDLPGLPVYLREKFDDLSDDGVARVERYVKRLRQQETKRGGDAKPGR